MLNQAAPNHNPDALLRKVSIDVAMSARACDRLLCCVRRLKLSLARVTGSRSERERDDDLNSLNIAWQWHVARPDVVGYGAT
jgi:hypothetical protein